jgi:hypothetical protein
MRLVILLVGGVAAGAASMGAVRTMVPENSQMFQAVHALGGNLSGFKIDDVNPLKAYERVRHEIASGNPGGSINFGSAKPIGFGNVGNLSMNNKLHIDDGATAARSGPVSTAAFSRTFAVRRTSRPTAVARWPGTARRRIRLCFPHSVVVVVIAREGGRPSNH